MNLVGLLYLLVLISGVDSLYLDFANTALFCIVSVPANTVLGNYITIMHAKGASSGCAYEQILQLIQPYLTGPFTKCNRKDDSEWSQGKAQAAVLRSDRMCQRTSPTLFTHHTYVEMWEECLGLLLEKLV